MQKYKVTENIWNVQIKRIEIDRESDASVWIDGRRYSKTNNYFSTFAEAKRYLISEAKRKIEVNQRLLQRAKDFLEKVNGLEEL